MSIIIFILVLSFLVIIHELGHFITAYKAGVNVEEFGLGYPPRLVNLFTWRGTKFSLNAIPFGGFVKMEGEDGKPSETAKNNSKKKKQVGPFYEKTALQRLVIILAGAFVNFVFGVIAFSIVFSFTGVPEALERPRIELVAQDSPASSSGLVPGIEITSIASFEGTRAIESIDEVIEFVGDNRGQVVTLTTTGQCQSRECDPSPQEFEVYIRNEDETPAGQGAMGVVFTSYINAFYPWYEMPFRGTWYGLQEAVFLGEFILEALQNLVVDLVVNKQVPGDLAGPVGIVHQAERSNIFSGGFLAVLSFSGMLSVNLAIMNVLPIPALDGGRAAFIILEKIIGRKRVEKVEGYANYGGYVILLGLIVLVTIRDVSRIITGS